MNSWLGVELRHLTALAAVAEEQSFRGAADRLGYVQSAVSQRIAQLEVAVGARLVERSRGHRHVALTEAGTALLYHAEQIQSHLNAARADLSSLSGDADSATLSVGAFGGLATRILPEALTRVAQRSPALRVEIREAQSDQDLFAAVQGGELDAAFAELPLESGRFEWREMLVDPLVLLVPADSPLAGRASPPELAEVAAQPLVVDPTWRMFKLIEAEFAAAGLKIDGRFSATSNSAVQALVAAGLGLAIMPRLAVDLDDPATVALDLSTVLPPRTLVCYWPSERRQSPELELFLDAMNAVCAPRRDVGAGLRASVELAA